MSDCIYCTYLTIYTGNKLPPFYIGSTSIKNNGSYGKKWFYDPKTNENIKCFPKDKPENFIPGRIIKPLSSKYPLLESNQLPSSQL